MDVTITVKDDHKLPLVIDPVEGTSLTVTEFCQRQIDALVDREDDRHLQKLEAQVPKADRLVFAKAEVDKIEAAAK